MEEKIDPLGFLCYVLGMKLVVQTHTTEGLPATITMEQSPKVLVMEELCGGIALCWRDNPAGERLQGFYASKTKARNAAKLLLPGVVLELPPRPEAANV